MREMGDDTTYPCHEARETVGRGNNTRGKEEGGETMTIPAPCLQASACQVVCTCIPAMTTGDGVGDRAEENGGMKAQHPAPTTASIGC